MEEDSDPDHWDLALLMSGVDMWAYTSPSSGEKAHTTMGLSTVTGGQTSLFKTLQLDFQTFQKSALCF